MFSQLVVLAAVCALAPAASPCFEIENALVVLPDHLWSETVTHPFEFRNTGSEALRITVQKTSCGCTAAVVSDATVPPGGTGRVQLTYTPEAKNKGLGVRSYSANLGTNDPLHPDVVLEMKFRLTEAVAATPEDLNFKAGSAATLPLSVACFHWNGPRKVLSVEPGSPELCVRPVETEEVEGGLTRYRYEVTYTPRESGKPLRANVKVRTDSPEVPVLEIPVRTETVSRLSASPAALLFGVVRPGQVATKTVVLIPRDAQSAPARAQSTDRRVRLTLEPVAGADKYRLTAQLQLPSAQAATEKIKTTVDLLDREDKVVGSVNLFALLMPPE